MKIIHATFFIKNDKRAQFLEDILPLIQSSRSEPGCVEYHLYESIEQKNQFVMIEKWESQAAIEGHNQNPLFKKLFVNLEEYAEKPTLVTIGNEVEQK